MDAAPPALTAPPALSEKGAGGRRTWHGHSPQFWTGVAAAATLVLLLILAVWWYLAHRQECAVDGDCAPGSVCIDHRCFRPGKATLADKWKFMALASVDQKCNGVDRSGTLMEGGGATKAPNFRAVKVGDFQCRGAAGLPGGPALRGGNWAAFCSQVGKAGAPLLSGTYPQEAVILVEGKTVVAAPPLSAGGLVVRRGGTCYLLPSAKAGAAFEFGFVLVESGGVLQAGSTGGSGKYRVPLETPLVLRLTGDAAGWWKTGVPASQYPCEVHNPGMATTDQCYGAPPGAAIEVACLANTTTPKSLGVCFNGTVHFAGWTPEEVPYHLWRALDGKSGASLTPGSLIAVDQYGSKAQEGVPDALGYRPWASYPATFVEVVGVGADGRSVTTKAPVDWPKGAQVAVSSPSPAWDYENCGTLPSGPGCFGGAPGCGARAPGFYVHGEGAPTPPNAKNGGVDVAVVASVARAGEGSRVTFTRALVFPHRAARSKFTSAAGDAVEVETYGHAALLSRSIRVEGAVVGTASQSSLPAAYFSQTGHQTSMPMGRFNATSVRTVLDASPCGPAPPQAKWTGPGGGVQCELAYRDTAPEGPHAPNGAVYTATGAADSIDAHLFSYYRAKLTPAQGCSAPPAPAAATPWYGQDPAKCQGLDCVLGGSVKVMYGASFRFDGVELTRMGLPGNSGSLGQYSVHFHLAGWGRAFRLYTLAPRELAFENCTNWRSFARFVVLHGTNLASVRNNVFVLGAGNGVFFEDGTEILNDVEHNLCLLTMSTSKFRTAYPEAGGSPLGGVIGNGGFDNQVVASIWVTNQNNHLARNVVAHNPGNSLGFWFLGESADNKQGPANLITGDPVLRLPGLVGNALVEVAPGRRRALYVPPESVLQGASAFFVKAETGDPVVRLNWKKPHASIAVTAYRLFAENVCYGCGGFTLENTSERGPFDFTFGAGGQFNTAALYDLSTWYMPANGDLGGAQLLHAYGGSYPRPGTVNRAGSWVTAPRVFCQNLVFDLGGIVGLGGAYGAIAWCQDGGFVSIGDAILGADFSSASTQAAWSNGRDWSTGTLDAILCGSVLGGPIPGGTVAAGGPFPRGVLIFGDALISATGSCLGNSASSRAAVFGGPADCQPASDGRPPSFAVVAGYRRKNPFGATDAAVAQTLAFLSRTNAGLLGMDPEDPANNASAGAPRIALYDYSGLQKGRACRQWKVPAGGGWASPQVEASNFTPSQKPPAAANWSAPMGCAPDDPSVRLASFPLGLSAIGQTLWSWLCSTAPRLPGYGKGA